MMKMLEPYMVTIMQAVISLIAVLVLGVIAGLRRKAEEWLAARTDARQRASLEQLAKDAEELAKAAEKSQAGGCGGSAPKQEEKKQPAAASRPEDSK